MDTLEKIKLTQRLSSEVLPQSVREPGIAVIRIWTAQNVLGIGGQSRVLHEVFVDPEFEFFSNSRCVGWVGPAGYSNSYYVFKLLG